MKIIKINILNNQPKIKHAMCHVPNFGIVAQGDVLTRPTNLIYKHFGIAYGLDEKNILWFLEFNEEGVRYVTLSEFLYNAPLSSLIIRNYPKLDWATIEKRAKDFLNVQYSARYCNCEHFVNHIFLG
ncbi:MAG: lecithin retinol acyltransferase family protein, partial [Cytophagales bacterium]|nr:lecithin retinol acyltransferase family protein [Cytophagales bacterium]